MKATDAARRLATKVADGTLPADEPVFVLRARDRFAASMVRNWAALAQKHGTPSEKVEDAMQIADEMEAWPTKQTPGKPETRSTRPVAGEVKAKKKRGAA